MNIEQNIRSKCRNNYLERSIEELLRFANKELEDIKLIVKTYSGENHAKK